MICDCDLGLLHHLAQGLNEVVEHIDILVNVPLIGLVRQYIPQLLRDHHAHVWVPVEDFLVLLTGEMRGT